MPAEFLCILPKNLTTHLTHKLYSVFPYIKGKDTVYVSLKNFDAVNVLSSVLRAVFAYFAYKKK